MAGPLLLRRMADEKRGLVLGIRRVGPAPQHCPAMKGRGRCVDRTLRLPGFDIFLLVSNPTEAR